MASLRMLVPGKTPEVYHLYKKITSMGKVRENDIVIPDPLIGDTHAHIHYDGKYYNIKPLTRQNPLHINGRKKKKHRLQEGDRIRIGGVELEFYLQDAPAEEDEAGTTMVEVNSYKKLYEFSQKLLADYEINSLLEKLMDMVIEITNADRGFLILMEGETPKIKVARNLRKENIADAVSQLSDSIIDKVIKTRRPLIISDALSDEEFANSLSVINLKLQSVMCVPLLEKGSLIGLIYVGNHNVIDLFEENSLEILTVFASQASLLIRNALLVNELQIDKQQLSERLDQIMYGEIIGSCPAMQEIYRKVDKIAGTDISVLITGDTGTGKELIAREIHRRSNRAEHPFVTINCGAIPENLLESELFGHVKGSFTGAIATKTGRFQQADNGSLFLDEVGELPLNLQVKLLRALQEHVVTKVGATQPENVNIRVIAATNRNLEEETRKGNFREDLYYRLNVVNVYLPPLKERGEDVVFIAKFLLDKYARELDCKTRGFSPNALVALKKFDWPGNIRQLENHIKKAVVLSDKNLLGPEDLGLSADVLEPIVPLAKAKEEFQRDYINEILQRNNGNRTKTAKDLDVDPRTIFRHLEKEDKIKQDED